MKSTRGAIIIIGILFFVFGFVTWLKVPLITYVKLAFGLDKDSKAFMVTTAPFQLKAQVEECFTIL
ncbi:MAG: hypothetical protein IPJ02_05455 [Chitinophagaceae bacterium]|nr:hypothetical protein [Chitinophagaceae bacterium]